MPKKQKQIEVDLKKESKHLNWGKKLEIILLVLLIVNLVFGFFLGVFLIAKNNSTAKQVKNLQIRVKNLEAENRVEPKKEFPFKPDSIIDRYLGQSDARYVWINYSDFQCPYSAKIFSNLVNVSKNNPDIALVYRHFPLTSIHPQAILFAQAAECAGLSDEIKFWQMADLIYQNQTRLDYQGLLILAQSIGVDPAKFQNCLTNNSTISKIQLDVLSASKLEGFKQSTPTGVIYDTKTGKSQVVVGYLSQQQIATVIQNFTK